MFIRNWGKCYWHHLYDLKSPMQLCVRATRWKLTATLRLLAPWYFWFSSKARSRNLG